VSDRALAATAVAVAFAATAAPAVPPAAGLLLAAAALVLRRPMLLAVALAVLVGARAHGESVALAAPLPERVEGVAELASDPVARAHEVTAIVRFDRRRYLAAVPHERAAALRSALFGERVHLIGRPRPLAGAPAGWVRSRHLAGRLSVQEVETFDAGAAWFRVANALHRTLSAGSTPFEGDLRALYLGLVLGDDREQSDPMAHRFRASGLTHLLAVSGSNVAFVLAAAAPLLSRLGLRSRAVAAIGLLALFGTVTRADPSVLRATAMAAIAVVAVTSGRVASGVRVLAVAVVCVLAVDPLLVHSLGFQLSVCATAGLVLLAGPIAGALPGPEWVAVPVGVTLAAQLATAPVLLAVTGGIPAVATLCNLLAGPAAGAVMTLGVTVGAVAGVVREPFASVLQLPSQGLVRWIDAVAHLGAAAPLAPIGPVRAAVLVVLGGSAVWLRTRARPGDVRRRSLPLLALVTAVVLLWPAPTRAGAHRLGASAVLWVGPCGGRVLELTGAGRSLPVLDGLAAHGVRHLDLVVAAPAARRTLVELLGQVPVAAARSATTAAPGLDALPAGVRLELGGVVVSSPTERGAAVGLELSGAPCSVTR
jgi:competence protein ComEC